MRNWVNFDWISADYINDVTIHQLDVALWCIGDELMPVRAFGTGGRLVRTGRDTGDLYDSMAVVYEFEDGRPLYAFSRQIPNSYGSSSTYITGEKGHAEMGNVGGGKVAIYGATPYEAARATVAANHLQHATLYQSIRGAIPYVNNLPYTAKATMAAILGKMTTHSGQLMAWEEALKAEAVIDPATITWDTVPPTLPDANGQYKIAVPRGSA
jgi:predicted dehydrogenase